jgi:hypothetical protein
MNRLIVVLLGLQLACDPAVGVTYRVSMQPAEADSIIPLSVAIADVLAQRHALGPRAPWEGCTLADYFFDFEGAHWVHFCVTRAGNAVEFGLSEAITRSWGPKGDSLRRELRDTLTMQFGPRVNELR